MTNPIRLICERGIELYIDEKNKCYFHTIVNDQSGLDPIEVIIKNRIRPIIETKYIAGNALTQLLTTEAKRFYFGLLKPNPSIFEDTQTLRHIMNLAYVVGAVCYHCEQLAKTYSEICYTFSRSFHSLIHKSDYATFQHQPEPYYELEALITTAIRSYNTMRYIIWNAFGPDDKQSVPSNFEKTLPLCKLPPKLESRLNHSLSIFGIKAKDYRDCTQHYVQICHELPHAHMKKIENVIWSTSIYIPDNPEARSQKQFKYDSQIDALTYGWGLTNEIFEVSQEIINAVVDNEISNDSK